VAAVLLSSDFLNRDSSPAAIKSILQASGIIDSDSIDPLRATPKIDTDTPASSDLACLDPYHHEMHLAFKAAVTAHGVFQGRYAIIHAVLLRNLSLHHSYLDFPISFYCIHSCLPSLVLRA
jgi:hypothetical protein